MTNLHEKINTMHEESLDAMHELSKQIEISTGMRSLPLGPRPDQDFLPMPMDIVRVVARVNAVEQIIREVMKAGVHYGPLFDGGPDGLKKPGIDILCLAFQFRIDYAEAAGTIRGADFISVAYRADVIHIPSGRIVASAIGSANSKEEKYRWSRGSGKPSCPKCGVDAVWASRDTTKPGFFCWGKKGGCGAKFAADDQTIISQKPQKTENDNAWEFMNVLEKIAQKRSGMAAIINACGLSNRFDIEAVPARKPAQQQEAPPPVDPIDQEQDDFHAELEPATLALIRAEAVSCREVADFNTLMKDLQKRRLWTRSAKEILDERYDFVFKSKPA